MRKRNGTADILTNGLGNHRSAERDNNNNRHAEIRKQVQRRLLSELSPVVDTDDVASVRRALEQIFVEICSEQRVPLSRTERERLFEQIVADVLGYGPIQPFLDDETVTEILVNGAEQIFVERNGILEETDVQFRDDGEVMHVIDRIVAPLHPPIEFLDPMPLNNHLRLPPRRRLQ